MSGASIAVEMGGTWVSGACRDRLVAQGLGACVSLSLYDSVARLAAMVHIVLPETPAAPLFDPPPGRCADTAVAHAVRLIVAQGADRTRLRAAMAGGSHIFSHAPSPGGRQSPAAPSRLEIGPRNADAVRAALAALDIPLVAEDVGGHCGRTVTLCVASGDVYVRRIGAGERRLGSLASPAPAPLRERDPEGALCAAR